jgi:deoxyadenosine/deoxycytidine kinase
MIESAYEEVKRRIWSRIRDYERKIQQLKDELEGLKKMAEAETK